MSGRNGDRRRDGRRGDPVRGNANTRRARIARPLIAAAVLAIALAAFSAIGAAAGGGAPTVETEVARSIGLTGLELNATVNPNDSRVSECDFEYGTSETLGKTVPCSYSPGAGETPVPVLADLEGLPETTVYYYRIHAKNGEGENNGAIHQATTLPAAPNVSNEPTSDIGHKSATLNGVVNPDDAEVTECYFEYGTSPSDLSSHVACETSPGSGSEPVDVKAAIGGLTESELYFFRLVARNSFGLERAGRGNFETQPSTPRANTEPANLVTHTSATLRGYVTPNSSTIEECYFEWGIHTSEEHRANCEQTEVGSGETPVAVTAALTGLSESTTYHFHLVAKNARGTGVGGNLAFSTLPFAPKVALQNPDELTSESAEMRARIDPQDEAITGCSFQYGTTPALEQSVNCTTLPGAGEKYTPVNAPVTGLAPVTVYYYRLKATDASGTTYSKTEKFTTFKTGLLPVITKIHPVKGSSAGGTAVTIKGDNLNGATVVRFGEFSTTEITSDSPESLTVVSPEGVGAVNVSVTTPNGESATVSGDVFTYGSATITGVSPNHGPLAGGTEVTVSGTGFEPGPSATKFTFGKATATGVECASTTSCTMIVPASSKGKKGTAKVQATVNGKGSKSNPAAIFTYE